MTEEQRPSTAPDFLLSRPTGSIRTQGFKATFPDAFHAATLLRSGHVPLIVGAFPFSTAEPAAFMEPEITVFSGSPLEPPAYFRGQRAASRLRVSRVSPLVTVEEHTQGVAAAVATIQQTRLDKAVLARAVEVHFASAPDPLLVAARLIDLSPHRDGFGVDLSVTGRSSHAGMFFTGSSPELLIARRGASIHAFPLAGSAPRTGSASADAEAARALQNSWKNLHEHRFVVDHYREVLEPVCSRLDMPSAPEVHETREMIHLGTHIRGELKDLDYSALDLALMLHPTPAVAGTPTQDALSIIDEYEDSRGFYAGAVGWCNSQGNGEFMVAIRSCEISGSVARAWAGGGIIAASDPQDEAKETTAKLQTVLRAMNVPSTLRVI